MKLPRQDADLFFQANVVALNRRRSYAQAAARLRFIARRSVW